MMRPAPRASRNGLGALAGIVLGGLVLGAAPRAEALILSWKSHVWQVTSGAMAGVCRGDENNVKVDSNGYLHLHIANSGGTWTSAELFTMDRLGFGTYQWQVDGPIDTLDKNVVLGLFPYGPAAGIGADGTNEIDIEYSRWGVAAGPNGDWTDYPASGMTIGELSYTFSLGGATLSTSRFAWSGSSITSALLSGLQPVDSSAGLIKTWTYAPTAPATNIPQQPLPLGMNLWCFDSPPSDGQPVEIVIRDFVFVPADTTGAGGGLGGSGGHAAGGAGGAPIGGAGAGGQGDGAISPAGTGGAAGRAGTGGAAGRAGTGGAGAGGSGTGGMATGGAAGASPPGAAGSGGRSSGAASNSGCSCGIATPLTSPPSLGAPLLLLHLVRRRRPAARARRDQS